MQEITITPDDKPASEPLRPDAGRSTNRGPKNVLDASAIAALLFAEPGADTVADAIADGAAISTVNVCEVGSVLTRRGLDPNELLAPLLNQVTVEPFTVADALVAALMSSQTVGVGLSIGDRACLALAKRLDAAAVTAEHTWALVNVSVTVHLIRQRQQGDP